MKKLVLKLFALIIIVGVLILNMPNLNTADAQEIVSQVDRTMLTVYSEASTQLSADFVDIIAKVESEDVDMILAKHDCLTKYNNIVNSITELGLSENDVTIKANMQHRDFFNLNFGEINFKSSIVIKIQNCDVTIADNVALAITNNGGEILGIKYNISTLEEVYSQLKSEAENSAMQNAQNVLGENIQLLENKHFFKPTSISVYNDNLNILENSKIIDVSARVIATFSLNTNNSEEQEAEIFDEKTTDSIDATLNSFDGLMEDKESSKND